MRVLVAADSAVVRAGLEALIAETQALSIIGSADTVALLERIRELQPDVVLLEWRNGSHQSLDSLFKSGPVFVLLAEDEDSAAIAAGLRAGLRAVLPQDASAQEITLAIEAAAEGLIVLHPGVLTALQLADPPRRPPGEPNASLTAREIEVLRMLAEGLANKNIAFQLGISEHTVKFHISSIFTKLNASSRAEAVAIGMRQGLILL